MGRKETTGTPIHNGRTPAPTTDSDVFAHDKNRGAIPVGASGLCGGNEVCGNLGKTHGAEKRQSTHTSGWGGTSPREVRHPHHADCLWSKKWTEKKTKWYEKKRT